MLTPWERHRVMQALEASDLIQVGGQHMLLIPVDNHILECFSVWGAEGADDEDNGDLEAECEDEGAEVDDEGFIEPC